MLRMIRIKCIHKIWQRNHQTGQSVQTCSSGEPNARHCTRTGIAPALRAVSMGGNSNLDNKRLSSRRAFTLFCIAPFPLELESEDRVGKTFNNRIQNQAVWMKDHHDDTLQK